MTVYMVYLANCLAAISFLGQTFAQTLVGSHGSRGQSSVIDSSIELCAESGCLEAAFIGNTCFAAVGDVNDQDTWNDSPQNAKKARDCMCGSEYWSHMVQ